MSRVKSAPMFANSAAKQCFYKVVGDRLRVVRDEAGLSMRDLARAIGASQSTINNIEVGQTCSLYVLTLIANHLDVTLDELIPLEATQ